MEALWKRRGARVRLWHGDGLVANPRGHPETLRPDARSPQPNVVYGGYSTSKEQSPLRTALGSNPAGGISTLDATRKPRG